MENERIRILLERQKKSKFSLKSELRCRRDQLLLQEQLSEPNRDLGEAHIKSLHEMEELNRVQELRID